MRGNGREIVCEPSNVAGKRLIFTMLINIMNSVNIYIVQISVTFCGKEKLV